LLRGWQAVTTLFFLTTTLESMAMGHLTAFTPLYLQEFGLEPDEVARWTGLLTALMMGVAFPLAPLWGALAERYARKPVVLRSQLVEALAFTLLAFAPDLTWVIVARLLLGLSFGNVSVLIATQSLLTPTARLGSAIATVQAAMPIAASIGPPLGATLLPALGPRGLFLLDAAVCLLAAVLIAVLMPEAHSPRTSTPVLRVAGQTLARVWRRPPLRWNFVAWFLTRGALAVLNAYIPVQIIRLADDPAPAIGLVLGVYGVIMAAATWGGGLVVDRVGPTRLYRPTMLAGALTGLGITLAPTLAILAVFVWLAAVPLALTGTVLYTHLAQTLQPGERTPVLSLTPFPRNTAMFALPALAALVAGFGPGAALALAAAAYAGAAAIGSFFSAASRPEPGKGDGAE
jgi:predicted MFS family arabinose efflux permease